MASRALRSCLATAALSVATLGAAAQPADDGARAAALGGAATALSGEVWGDANPAAWATLTGRRVAFLASERFTMAELRTACLRYVEPTRWGTFAAGGRTFGFDDYRETDFTAGFARRLGTAGESGVFAGVHLGFHRLSITGYGGASAVSLSVGFLAAVTPRAHVGLQARNVNDAAYADGAPLPRSLALGLAFAAAPGVQVVVDAGKELRHPLTIRTGLEFTPVPALALRAGVSTVPRLFAAGAGLRLGHLAADVAAQRHELLGWTPTVELGVLW